MDADWSRSNPTHDFCLARAALSSSRTFIEHNNGFHIWNAVVPYMELLTLHNDHARAIFKRLQRLVCLIPFTNVAETPDKWLNRCETSSI